MKSLVIGLSHATAPVELRERFTLAQDALAATLANARGSFRECVVLSTCNRFEVYGRLTCETDALPLVSALTGTDASRASDHLYVHRERAAVRHLFRVAAGAESLVPGEVEILGQVRRAWQAAHGVHASGPLLSQLFHRAVALGKRVRSETRIGRDPASVSSAAVRLARTVVGRDLAQRRVLIIGTGEVGQGVARCLYEHGATATILTHREVGRAREIARRFQARLATWDRLPVELAWADIVISSTAAPHFVLRQDLVRAVAPQRDGRPLCLIDLAVPRDVEPSVAFLPGVCLYDIDDLRDVVHETIERRRAELPRIETMIESEVARFDEWLRARSVAPAIRRLRTETDRIIRDESSRAVASLRDLSPVQRRAVEAMAARIAGKVVHQSIQWLKSTTRGVGGASDSEVD